MHVLAGCRELLKPEFLSPETLAHLIGPGTRVARAYWLPQNHGDEYHDFLQDGSGDMRTTVMAEALKDGFGARFEPLLVLADLLKESKSENFRDSSSVGSDRRSQYSVLSEILASGYFRELNLYGMAISSKADPDRSWAEPAAIAPARVREQIEKLPAAFADHVKPNAITTNVIEVAPDFLDFNVLYNNALCSQFAPRIELRMLESGWRPDIESLTAAISSIVSDWNNSGMFLAMPLRKEQFESMSDLLYDKLLQK